MYYHCFLAYNNRLKSKMLLKENKLDEAVSALKDSLHHAMEYDKFMDENTVYSFTSPFFDQVEYCTDDICRTGTTTQTDDFYEAIKHSDFDRLRNIEGFKELF